VLPTKARRSPRPPLAASAPIVYGRQMTSLRSFLVLLSLLGVLAIAPSASAAPGDLDPSFGSGGSVRLLPSEEKVSLRAVAVQPDLKIVLAGSEEPGSVILVRLLPDGALDPSFGAGGKVTTPFPGGFGEARAIVLQPDGKIVIAGEAKGAVNGDFLIARYNADGSPDASFGDGDGIQLVPIGIGQDRAQAVAIGAGGRILATGTTDLEGGKTNAAVAMLDANGNPDSAFTGDGTMTIDTTADDSDKGVAIAGLADGRILVGDSTANGAGDGFTLVQLLPTGLPDPGFGGGDGIVKTPIPGSDAGRLTDFALRPDGRIVASGYGFEEVGPPFSLDDMFAAVGYLASGELDPSFAEAGIFTHQIEEGDGVEAAQEVELTPTGKVLLAGTYDPAPGNASTALLRLDPLGELDPAFGSEGEVLRGILAPFGEIFQDAALDAEERLVVASTAYIGGNVTELVVSRYLGDPRPQPPAQPPSPPRATPAPPRNLAARALMKKVPKKIAAEDLKGFSGTASDADGNGVQRVEIALASWVGKPSGGRPLAIRRCLVLKNRKLRFERVREESRNKCPQRWLTAKGTAKWSFKLKGALPPGRYVVYARATDGKGEAETSFSRKLGNRYAFNVLPSR
jgi:uncharacterized delta-60 repeat protein